MKEIYLHIGTHKTGTTSLQMYCDMHKHDLIKKNILYPKTGWQHHAQHKIAFSLQKIDKSTDGLLSKLVKEIRETNQKKIIISSEEFSNLNEEGIEKLYSYLSEFKIKIVIYLRRQDFLFESVYNQQTKDWKSPRKEPIEYFINGSGKLTDICQYLNYYEMLQQWEKYFSKENIVIREYSIINDTISDFFNILDIVIKPENTLYTNKSISLKGLELIRLSKHVIKDINKRKKIYELSTKIFTHEKDESLLSDEERLKIINKYYDSNKLLKNMFGQEFKSLLDKQIVKNNKTLLTRTDILYVLDKLLEKDIEPSEK